MRRLLLSGLLLALLLTTAGVVYAGVTWEDDPHIGSGIWLSWTVSAADPADGWTPNVKYKAAVERERDEIEVKATVKTARYRGEGHCTIDAFLTQGEGGPVLAMESGRCGRELRLKWESD